MKKIKVSRNAKLAAIAGASIVAGAVSATSAYASQASGFAILGSANQVRSILLNKSSNGSVEVVYAGSHDGDHGKGHEGKCGEGKCGDDKKAGEGKCGEGKCGDDESGKSGEGKCGEGSCGDKGGKH